MPAANEPPIPAAAAWPPPRGRAAARAPGVCGELVQGMSGDAYFLVTCPVDFFAWAQVAVYPAGTGIAAPPDCPKTAAAVAQALAYLGHPDLGARVSVRNPIPRGKGMGSSSADLTAAIAATALALNATLSPAEIGQIAVQVEPTDGVMFPGIALFDHRNGTIAEELGPPPPLEIIALDFGGAVDTVDFNRVDRRAQWQARQADTDDALALVRQGLAAGDARLIGQGASRSAAANQHILFKPRLPEVIRFAERVGAVGVNVAHSGPVIGLLLDAKERRGRSVFRQARQAFPAAAALYHLRLISGGVRPG